MTTAALLATSVIMAQITSRRFHPMIQGLSRVWRDWRWPRSIVPVGVFGRPISSPRKGAYALSDVSGTGRWMTAEPQTGSKPSMIDLINWEE